VWVAGVAVQRGGDVDRLRPAQHPDDQVAQGHHDVRAAVGADLGGVLGEGDIGISVGGAGRGRPPQAAARRAGLEVVEKLLTARRERHELGCRLRPPE
jgi:hypothetical protein